MPARVPPHKPPGEDPGASHRLRMCELLVAGQRGVAVSAVEMERDGPSYTVDTLRAIHASHPDSELTFIVGEDAAATLPSWREPAALLALARLAVAERVERIGADAARRRVLGAVSGVAGGGEAGARLAADVRFLDMPPLEVSSSQVRERVARGEPVEWLVGSAVARYIAAHGLYGAARPAQTADGAPRRPVMRGAGDAGEAG